ncbi:MAG: cell division ATP-binding protein FtsE [Alphaproteobacteria bacterium]|nr:cell division ATP-binding protein FtsE [Alphaproteobacteria bacterium]
MQPLFDSLPVVDFHRVFLKYDNGHSVLKNIQFSLEKGSFHFVTGASGAGKTSLLKLMYLAVHPTSGRLQIFGKDLSQVSASKLPDFRRRIGVVFQDFRLLDTLNTFDNVALPLRIIGMGEKEIKRRVGELLSWVGLENCMNEYPQALSGGEKQRIAIARAVINKPDLLLADEPTGNVDDAMAARILHLFLELNRLGTTLVIATHNQSLVRQFNKPQLHLSQGTLEIIQPMMTIEEENV